jgi:hypothetical protein
MSNGEPCPKCGQIMRRDSHDDDWRPRPGQRYYFAAWDYCADCRHVQHYEKFKVLATAMPPSPQGELFAQMPKPRRRIRNPFESIQSRFNPHQQPYRFHKPRGKNWAPPPVLPVFSKAAFVIEQ